MTFTDDDLKRLKELAYVPIPAGQYLETTLDNQFLRDFIVRLEAAEVVCERVITMDSGRCGKAPCRNLRK